MEVFELNNRVILRDLYFKDQQQVANELGITVASLNRSCHQVGLSRWPHTNHLQHATRRALVPVSAGLKRKACEKANNILDDEESDDDEEEAEIFEQHKTRRIEEGGDAMVDDDDDEDDDDASSESSSDDDTSSDSEIEAACLQALARQKTRKVVVEEVVENQPVSPLPAGGIDNGITEASPEEEDDDVESDDNSSSSSSESDDDEEIEEIEEERENQISENSNAIPKISTTSMSTSGSIQSDNSGNAGANRMWQRKSAAEEINGDEELIWENAASFSSARQQQQQQQPAAASTSVLSHHYCTGANCRCHRQFSSETRQRVVAFIESRRQQQQWQICEQQKESLRKLYQTSRPATKIDVGEHFATLPPMVVVPLFKSKSCLLPKWWFGSV